MALVKATVTENLNPETAPPAKVALTAAAVSDGLDAALSDPTNQEVAISEPAAPAPTPATQAAVYVQPHAVEVDEFANLDDLVNFTSFPTAKIEQGSIFLDGAKVAEGKLTVLITQVSFQWIVKSSLAQDAKYYFSPDGGVTDSKKNSGEAIKREWLANGAKASEFNIKQYAVVHAINKATGSMIAISVPPTSLGRLGGYKKELQAFRGKALNQCWTTAGLGETQKSEINGSKVSWTPWNFKFESPLVVDVVEPK